MREKGRTMEKIICWLFVKAQDMRVLLKVSRDILIVTFNEIKLNPLEPVEGMKATEWASIFADLWIQAFRLYEGSKGFLIECLNTLYIKHEKTGYPSLFDLYYYVRGAAFSCNIKKREVSGVCFEQARRIDLRLSGSCV